MGDALAGLPKRIGRYEPRGVLGFGRLGRVLLGHDPVLSRDVALKLFEEGAVPEDSLDEVRHIFHLEARATAALRHPGIVELYDYSGPDADLMYLACECIIGPTLRDVLEERSALAPAVVAALGFELCQALDHAHSHEIVHRDLKPENIFWMDTGRIVLSDFGIAKVFSGSGRLGNTVAGGAAVYGSPAYMAPEQLEGKQIGPATDLHALGAVLFECLTGQQAFEGDSIEAILDAVQHDVRPSLTGKATAPQELVDLVHGLLARAPDRRPASARVAAQALRDALDALDVTDPRAVLRDFGDQKQMAPAADDDETEIFSQPEQLAIRAPKPGGALAGLAARGPFIFAMAAMAVALAVAAYMFMNLADLPETGLFPDRTVTIEPGRPPTLADSEDIFVLVEFTGLASVAVESPTMARRDLGEFTNSIRFALTPGQWTLIVTFPTGPVRREVLLVPNTEPTFTFTPPEETPAPAPSNEPR